MRIKIFGDRLDVGSVGSRQVRAIPASKTAAAPLQVWRYCRNGRHPSAQYWNRLNEQTNQAALYRTKELFNWMSRVGFGVTGTPTSSGAGDRDRWRFAFHTS